MLGAALADGGSSKKRDSLACVGLFTETNNLSDMLESPLRKEV